MLIKAIFMCTSCSRYKIESYGRFTSLENKNPCGFHKKFTLDSLRISTAKKRPFKSFILHENDNYLKEDEKVKN